MRIFTKSEILQVSFDNRIKTQNIVWTLKKDIAEGWPGQGVRGKGKGLRRRGAGGRARLTSKPGFLAIPLLGEEISSPYEQDDYAGTAHSKCSSTVWGGDI